MRFPALLMLILSLAYALPVNMIRASGDVWLDGKKIASINSTTPAYILLPLIPGKHTIRSSLGEMHYHIFDVSCESYGGIRCEISSLANITLPVRVKCGGIVYESRIELKTNETKKIEIKCRGNASVEIGDWKRSFYVEDLFVNEIEGKGGRWVYVYRDGELVLKKYARGKVSFPELEPGTYRVVIVDNSTIEGRLVIEREVRLMVIGYSLAAMLVIAALVLLVTD